ncbi:restriction endonuclease subunit S [Acetivibrio straminisolvens]|jgi:type I restriction enzyme S subunit|uniref:Type I restriction-modification system n=1 Tax=Acetivibrio straminisolvens JCM 21531 TaxID=1294263 RepID=W4V6W8_9FIRM|nr:restriction endonuclease subunit S [Acetivibrio straminisolvens]GAE88942.1 type I restriction-modification system [Acetivibrio straminisolvens JCM 21531]
MSWKEVTIGSFLKERPDKIKPDQANSLGLKRIEKIDFSGNIYLLENTSTKTNMIIVKPGDLVISGINVAKGALAVYEGTEDVLATIHYSSYEFDKSIIDIEYLKWFLTSNKFMNVLKEQVGGGIKTELKPKKFLPLKIKLPDINLQTEIAKRINNVSNEIELLKVTNEKNYELISKLRQAILQEAVQGKLVPQDPNDEPANVLLEKIKEEKERLIKKGKINKEKPLPPITGDEIPYELPKGWEWVRLGCIVNVKSSKRIYESDYKASGIPFFRSKEIGELSQGKNISSEYYISIDKYKEIKDKYGTPLKGDLLLTSVGSIGNTWISDGREFYYKDGNVTQIDNNKFLDMKYIQNFIKSPLFFKQVNSSVSGTAYNALTIIKIKNLIFPLPPLNEQKRIVEKVDHLMDLCDKLEKNIEESKKDSELLMQSVLHEAFNEV